MTTQPTGPLVPGVGAATAGALSDDERLASADDENRATDEGVPVGEADVRADVEHSGGRTEDDGMFGAPADDLVPDVDDDTSRTDQGMPVGEADAQADRRRAGADDA